LVLWLQLKQSPISQYFEYNSEVDRGFGNNRNKSSIR
jgi:hypothetical protein